MQHALRVELYLRIKAWLLANDPDAQRMLEWSRNELAPPTSPEDLASEVVWVILCAGRSAQAARTIERKVWIALHAGTPVVDAFGYRAKAAAIERAWRERDADFLAMRRAMASNDPQSIIDWCGSIPFVGDDTKYQLAKNCGVTSVVKPDIWLCRLAGIPDRPRLPVRVRFARCQAMAQELAAGSGDTVAVIDSLLWTAANKGLLDIRFDPHTIQFNERAPRARSFYATADESPSDGQRPGSLDLTPTHESLS